MDTVNDRGGSPPKGPRTPPPAPPNPGDPPPGYMICNGQVIGPCPCVCVPKVCTVTLQYIVDAPKDVQPVFNQSDAMCTAGVELAAAMAVVKIMEMLP